MATHRINVADYACDAVAAMSVNDIRAAFHALRTAAERDPGGPYWNVLLTGCGLTAAEFALGYSLRRRGR